MEECEGTRRWSDTYHFAIEIVLANHDRVDRLGIDKVEKRETS